MNINASQKPQGWPVGLQCYQQVRVQTKTNKNTNRSVYWVAAQLKTSPGRQPKSNKKKHGMSDSFIVFYKYTKSVRPAMCLVTMGSHVVSGISLLTVEHVTRGTSWQWVILTFSSTLSGLSRQCLVLISWQPCVTVDSAERGNVSAASIGSNNGSGRWAWSRIDLFCIN